VCPFCSVSTQMVAQAGFLTCTDTIAETLFAAVAACLVCRRIRAGHRMALATVGGNEPEKNAQNASETSSSPVDQHFEDAAAKEKPDIEAGPPDEAPTVYTAIVDLEPPSGGDWTLQPEVEQGPPERSLLPNGSESAPAFLPADECPGQDAAGTCIAEPSRAADSEPPNSLHPLDEMPGPEPASGPIDSPASPLQRARLPLGVLWTQMRLRPGDIAFALDSRGQRILLSEGRHGAVYRASLWGARDACVVCVPATGPAARGLSSPDGRNLVLAELALLKERCPRFVVNLLGACFENGEAQVVVEMVPREAGA
jgi:hypothetical protein